MKLHNFLVPIQNITVGAALFYFLVTTNCKDRQDLCKIPFCKSAVIRLKREAKTKGSEGAGVGRQGIKHGQLPLK